MHPNGLDGQWQTANQTSDFHWNIWRKLQKLCAQFRIFMTEFMQSLMIFSSLLNINTKQTAGELNKGLPEQWPQRPIPFLSIILAFKFQICFI